MSIRIQVEWSGLAGAPGLSTFWGPGAGQEQATISRDIVADFLDSIRPNIDGSWDYSLLPEAVDYSTPDTPVDVYPVDPLTGSGSGVSGALARATQGLIRLRTNAYRGARRVQGRLFIPGPGVQALGSGGAPASSYVTALTNAGAILVAGNFSVASRVANEFYPIAQAVGWDQFAVLRSRRD